MLVKKFPIREVLEFYGADQLPHRHGWAKIKCVIHDDSSPSASFNEEKGSFRCFTCGFYGDAIDLIRHKESASWHEAVERAQEITGQDGNVVTDSGPGKPQRHRPVRIGEVRTAGGGSPRTASSSSSKPAGRRRPRRIV